MEPQPGRPPGEAGVRFEAKVLPGPRRVALERVADLDLDRVPDPEGAVRVLISAEDAERLLAAGFEVLLVAAHRIGPVDPALIMEDKAALSWLEERTQGLRRQGDA